MSYPTISIMIKKLGEKYFDYKLKEIIKQGNQDQYRELIKKIVQFHILEYTEDNFATTKHFILYMVNNVLDEIG